MIDPNHIDYVTFTLWHSKKVRIGAKEPVDFKTGIMLPVYKTGIIMYDDELQ